MCDSDSDSVLPSLGASDAEDLRGLPSPAVVNRVSSRPARPVLPCAASKLSCRTPGIPSIEYSPPDASWTFTDISLSSEGALVRNAIFRKGEVFAVRSISPWAYRCAGLSAVCISRTVGSLGEHCLNERWSLKIVAFESDSHLREIGRSAFCKCQCLRSIAIPFTVATIEHAVFLGCRSLSRFVIPASVTALGESVFLNSGISSIEIDEGSVSFRVVNQFLVDFEVRSLSWVIGSPESIVIPSSIEQLRPYCCAWHDKVRSVVFEPDSRLRSIDRSAFQFCVSLEAISIPSSVEILSVACFDDCFRLQTVTLPADSRLRLIQCNASRYARSPEFVSVPPSATVIHGQPSSFP
jgi:hypothetical protein